MPDRIQHVVRVGHCVFEKSTGDLIHTLKGDFPVPDIGKAGKDQKRDDRHCDQNGIGFRS